MSDDIRRKMALFPIGIVMKITELTARQIRYYETNGLIQPARSESNQRLFSFQDVDHLLMIKSYIDQGLNIAGIKQVINREQPHPVPEEIAVMTEKSEQKRKEMTDAELRQLLKQQIMHKRLGETPLIRGELSRFYHY